MTDVIAAMEADKRGYSLGQVHIAAPEGATVASLVDGHQRGITLAIIFAILRDLADSEGSDQGARFHALIERSHVPPGSEERWRLTTQQHMAAFFRRYVQTRGCTSLDPEVDISDLAPAERNLLMNRERLRTALGPGSLSSSERQRFADFLMHRCFFVIVEVDDEDDAWSMLGIEQSTRLPHNPSEQAKITLIYSMPEAQQEQAGVAWEAAQTLLEPAVMTDLLYQLRTLKLERRSMKPLECDLQRLYGLNVNGLDFVNNVLLPAAEAVKRIEERDVDVGSEKVRDEVKGHIDALHILDNRLWVAPAVGWLLLRGDNDPETVGFFWRLQRLGWALRVAGTDPSEQERRFIHLTSALEQDTALNKLESFSVSEKTRQDALANLRSRTFYHKHYCPPVLRLSCYLLGTDPGIVDGRRISVEHILPRRPPKERLWLRDFRSLRGVANHTNRLGNLTLLSCEQNRLASTQDWLAKREILRDSGYPISQRASLSEAWTAAVIEARTEELIAMLFAKWDLKVTPA